MSVLIAASLLTMPAASPHTVVIQAGKFDRAGTVIEANIPKHLPQGGQVSLHRVADGKEILAQVISGKPARLLWVLDKPLKAGKSREYSLSWVKRREERPRAVCAVEKSGDLVITLDGKKTLRYNVAVKKAQKLPVAQSRSGHIHPLYAPNGEMVTDDFSPDHPHQRGVFFAWTKTKFQGKNIDFWNLHRNNGRTEHKKMLTNWSGRVACGFVAENQMVAASYPKKGTAAITDVWSVRAIEVPGGFLIDIESSQTCATTHPLLLEKYHYGGFAIRGNREWDAASPFAMITSEGKRRKQGNHTRPKWVEFGGPANNKPTGVTIFGHPGNFRFPQHVRLHPKMPYFCFAPMVAGKFEIKPGKPFVSRYRLFVHASKPDAKRSERLWRDYESPVRATIKVSGKDLPSPR